MSYPNGPAPALPDRHGGALRVDASKCTAGCTDCVPVCPTEAITIVDGKAVIDQKKCNQCLTCIEECPTDAIHEE